MVSDKKITFRSRLRFIGLGYLGSRMTRRLIAAGFPVVAYGLDHTNASPCHSRVVPWTTCR
jgi:3-hydroxyisobutyrate dehydrogenase-like beta-hydroxyacid dehydrogenase